MTGIDGSFVLVIFHFHWGTLEIYFRKQLKKRSFLDFWVLFLVSTRRQNELGIRCFIGIKACSARGSISLNLTMTTKGVKTTQHRHTEKVQWNHCHNPYLPIREGRGRLGTETASTEISQAVNSKRSAKISKEKQAKLSHAITCKPLQTVKQTRGSPRTSLPAWGSTADPLVMSRG